MVRYCSFATVLFLSSVLLCGCAKSGPASPSNFSTTKSDSAVKSTSATTGDSKSKSVYWEDYPDVPKVEIMTEVDGIKIPRMSLKQDTLKLTGAVPADVGNEHAKQKASEPVTGDTLTVRFNSEPKVLNPMTENSAVMRYIMQYVNDPLFKQNNETFEYEPRLAKSQIVEDSVKLSADYPGRERRVAMSGASAQATIELDYVMPPPTGGKSAEGPKLTLVTSDKDGNPVGHTWVGIFPIGKIPGASTTGYHDWTDDKGQLVIGGFPTGKYTIRTGDEVFGQSQRQDNGVLVVTPASPENPLREAMTLKEGEWQDVQEKTYATFYLREDAKWSDGVPFTTRDLEFGYALLNSPFVDGDSTRTYYADLVECKALSPQIIRMRYRQQYFKAAEFRNEMSIYISPMHFFEAIFKAQGRELTLDPLTPAEEAAKKQISARGQEFGKFYNTDERYNSKPLGNGSYIVDKWERKDRVELVRNPNYWEPSKAGHVDRIIIKFIPDQVTALTALRAGEIDFYYDMDSVQYFDDWPTLDQTTQENYVKAAWFSPQFQYLGWNELAGPFKDRRVRIALTMLLDRQDFVDKKLHGDAIVVSGAQYVFGPAYDNAVAPIGYDPETARDLLTEAGWTDSDNDGILDRNGEKFQITLRVPQGRAIYTQIAEVLQKNLKNVGIDLQIQMMEWASFIDKFRAKECDATIARWAMPIESDPFQIWHSSEGAREKRGSNTISFRNQKADELIEMLRVTLDDGKRFRINQSLHRLLDSEQPYTFLWAPKEFGAYHKRFRNVKWYRLRPGFNLAEWYVPKEEQLHK